MPVAARGIEGTSESARVIFQAGYLLGMAAMFYRAVFFDMQYADHKHATWRHSEGTMKSKQSGVTLIGFLFLIIIVGFFAYMAMKLFPSYSESMGVSKAMNQIATAGTNGKTLDDIRRDLFFKLGFQYVDDATIKPSDITIKRDAGGGNTLNVDYDKQIPFMYNIDFLLHFHKSVPLQGNVGQ
ncbi:type II secretory pathway pseudopilin PulG [Rhodanobacter sp. ANJX3]|uniref:DUF4845 domain-containing protein n=2 Tax=unclassified Rhodanobacter TaxID=2621553 RepID=UPI0017DCFB7E|nr:DUF4845 domain-containing protein [Rhodanobacter sp. ANJX3]MBB5357423.1 type II secretory pathway pseudopilin PulG [Rhodanobacter sp. ANJX3]NYE27471.1 type II secretory pathway pseudopilin PulG [Rhodanobacter sp. K2T2]